MYWFPLPSNYPSRYDLYGVQSAIKPQINKSVVEIKIELCAVLCTLFRKELYKCVSVQISDITFTCINFLFQSLMFSGFDVFAAIVQ